MTEWTHDAMPANPDGDFAGRCLRCNKPLTEHPEHPEHFPGDTYATTGPAAMPGRHARPIVRTVQRIVDRPMNLPDPAEYIPQATDYDRAIAAATDYDRQHRALIIKAVTGPLIDRNPLPISRCTAILARAAESERREAEYLSDAA